MNHNLFVYGTLKKGQYNNFLLEDQEYIGEGTTYNKYKLVTNILPYLYKEPFDNITGDIYIINDKKLKELDEFEGHPYLYCREQINIMYENKIIECWCYFYNEKNYDKGGE